MCCLVTVMMLLGPRFLGLIWWISDPARWDRAFSTAIWPVLGLLFAPWTTLAFVIGQPGGFNGFDTFLIVIAILADAASYAGGGYGNRTRIPNYATR
jgi:hypothetical protein